MKPQNSPLILLVVALLLPGAVSADVSVRLSKSDRHLYERAFAAADPGRWAAAHNTASQARDKLPAKVIKWMHMTRRDRAHRFEDIAAFMKANPDWPGMKTLRRNAEQAMDSKIPAARVRDWFAAHPPLTTEGRVRYIEALFAGGRTQEATKLVKHTWRTGSFGSKQGRSFRRKYRKYLNKADHAARLDRLLWNGRTSQARRMLRLVDVRLQKLAAARISLRASRGGVDWHIRQVPADLVSDPGFVYERVRWRRLKGRDDGAYDLLKNVPPDAPRAKKWWVERSILARRLLAKGYVSEAYRIAQAHGLKDGARFVEAEWLSGWIALRFLKDGDVALRHFERIRRTVKYPISLARASYWIGRASLEKGDKPAAAAAFREAARHGTTYYGQLAAAENGIATGLADRTPEPGRSATAVFNADERVRVVRMLKQVRAYGVIRHFTDTLMRETDEPVRQVLVARLAEDIGRRDHAVRVGRRAYRFDLPMPEIAYPILTMRNATPAPALSHAIIRQESNFDASAISPAGARGLMQLMPRTAKEVAKKLKIKYSRHRLTSNPSYNIRLGRAYLARLLSRFDRSYVLAIAAYNAGPGAAKRWIRENGDPRDAGVDVIDWVESIPYRETRNYVQRVMENIQVYRARLGEAQVAEGIVRDLKR
ncbi:MAG: lytic transglycosylase domain-containing protein [Alphaproteobacteria bacterium]